jgi:ribosomal protein S18 acetylase RimI-like enzyme
MEIRQATQADANHLAELCMCVQALHVEIQPALFRKPRHADLVDFFRDRLSAPDFTSFLAMDGSEPVGYVVLHTIRRPAHVLIRAREIVEIDHIHVAETHQRRGIARRLAAKALEVAHSYGIQTIQLSVWAQNDQAVAAFEALGFKPQRHIMTLDNREKLEPVSSVDSQG